MAELAGPVGPVTKKDRFITLDVIRGVALFGILLMNITMFGLPNAYEDPTVYGGADGYNLWAWITTTMLFEGTQRGLFSILFGAGIVLLTARLEKSGKPGAGEIFFRRNLWLVLFGIIHAYLLLWPGEILYYYGLTALVVYAFRVMSPKNLFIIAFAGLLVGAAWNGYDTHSAYDKHLKFEAASEVIEAGGTLSEAQQDDVEAWNDLVSEHKPDEKTNQKEIAGHLGTYFEQVLHQAPDNAYYESWWFYRYFFDLASMMLIGMALFKMGVLTLKSSTRLYAGMMLGGYAIGLTTNYYEVATIIAGDFSVLSFLKTYPTYDLGRLAMTVGHLGFLLLFCRSGIFGWLQRALAAVGQLALTNYVSHSIICGIIFYGLGFGLYGQLERYELYYVVFAIWIVQLIISPIWLKHFRFGPLEWLWRSLTYMKKQPMKR